MTSLPNELLVSLFGHVEASDRASSLKISSHKHYPDLNLKIHKWILRRMAFNTHTCRLVCRKWNLLILPQVFSRVEVENDARCGSLLDLLRAPLARPTAYSVTHLSLQNWHPATVKDHLQAFLPILHSLQSLELSTPVRIPSNETSKATLLEPAAMVGPADHIAGHRFDLRTFTVADSSIRSTDTASISRCLQLFSHIDTLNLRYDFAVESFYSALPGPRTPGPVIRYLSMGMTHPSVARNLLREANCTRDLPSHLAVRFAYAPSSMRSLTELLSLYCVTEEAPQDDSTSGGGNPGALSRLTELSVTIMPLCLYTPSLQVDVIGEPPVMHEQVSFVPTYFTDCKRNSNLRRRRCILGPSRRPTQIDLRPHMSDTYIALLRR